MDQLHNPPRGGVRARRGRGAYGSLPGGQPSSLDSPGRCSIAVVLNDPALLGLSGLLAVLGLLLALTLQKVDDLADLRRVIRRAVIDNENVRAPQRLNVRAQVERVERRQDLVHPDIAQVQHPEAL